MNYATNIAIIDRETMTVSNVIWGMVYQLEEFNNEKRIAVEVGDLAVTSGDSYDGEAFFHEGVKVRSNAEIIAEMAAQLADAEAALKVMEVHYDEA